MAIYYIDPVLAAAAIIPAVVLLIKVYQADRLEKEPVSLILSLVFFGVYYVFCFRIRCAVDGDSNGARAGRHRGAG